MPRSHYVLQTCKDENHRRCRVEINGRYCSCECHRTLRTPKIKSLRKKNKLFVTLSIAEAKERLLQSLREQGKLKE